ncbi:MAG: Maf family protein [Gammaproteobacteria bacterium WSBS_2016_MAG_OTU1]
MQKIILASTSPYRRQLLSRLHIEFACASPDTDETIINGEPPDARALRLAEEKARAVATSYPQAIIIGGDQTISGNGHIFDKPGDEETAISQLQEMRGRNLHFFTAVAVLNATTNSIQSKLTSHRAILRKLSDEEINRYVKKEPAFNCAGGAQIEGLGVSLLESIEGGDPTAIVGMSLIAVSEMLRQNGAQIP